MTDRTFRTSESIEFELETRDRIPDFLEELGCTGITDNRPGNSQVVATALPNGERVVARVKLCWRKASHGSRRSRPFSAAQLMARIKDGDWVGSIQSSVERARSQGITHYLFVQREDERITHAALVPIDALVPIWIKQRDTSSRLVGRGALQRISKNHAMNGASPTIYVQEERAPEIADALWDHPGVVDMIALHPLRGGGGFGRPDSNRLIEREAIATVTLLYLEDGWKVESREADRCGYDLECSKGEMVEHVEVKGVSGSEPTFMITHGEVDRARFDPDFILFVVTRALSGTPDLHRYSGTEFVTRFRLLGIQYRASLVASRSEE